MTMCARAGLLKIFSNAVKAPTTYICVGEDARLVREGVNILFKPCGNSRQCHPPVPPQFLVPPAIVPCFLESLMSSDLFPNQNFTFMGLWRAKRMYVEVAKHNQDPLVCAYDRCMYILCCSWQDELVYLLHHIYIVVTLVLSFLLLIFFLSLFPGGSVLEPVLQRSVGETPRLHRSQPRVVAVCRRPVHGQKLGPRQAQATHAGACPSCRKFCTCKYMCHI